MIINKTLIFKIVCLYRWGLLLFLIAQLKKEILTLGIAASLNQPFSPQQFGMFRM